LEDLKYYANRVKTSILISKRGSCPRFSHAARPNKTCQLGISNRISRSRNPIRVSCHHPQAAKKQKLPTWS